MTDTNINLVKGKIKEHGLTQKKVADKLNISPQAFNSKINGKTEFTVAEIESLCAILNIRDVIKYFFVSM